MKRIFIVIVLLTVISNYSMATTEDNLHWIQRCKIRFVYTLGIIFSDSGEWKGHPTEGGEHFMLYERIPLKEYATIAKDFNPVKFDAKKWVRAAKHARNEIFGIYD